MAVTRIDFPNHKPIAGELLAERLAAGPLAAGEALRYAIELGSEIGRAHLRGLVHGGICPESIVITAGGVRLLAPDSAHDRAPYTAPEHWRAQRVDTRSDIFTFGAVAYEMAVGRRPFAGSGAELKEAILSRPMESPDSDSPAIAALMSVISGCLEKNPERRRQRIQNAVIELKLAGRTGSHKEDPPEAPSRPKDHAAPLPADPAPSLRPEAYPAATFSKAAAAPIYAAFDGAPTYANAFRRRIGFMIAAALALTASGIAAVVYLNKRPAVPVLKFAVTQPEHTSYPGMPAVSPDGRYLTFSAVGPEGKRMLWLRPLDALHATVIAGSEGASAPFWSPDSQYIAFFAARALERVKVSGGSPERICDAEASPGGGAWNPDGSILFSPSLSDGFYRVPSSGGKPQSLQKLDEAKGERGNLWPHFLPDGKHFLFYQQTDNEETAGVYLGSLEPAGQRRLFASQTNAVYSAADSKHGYLLYIHERNLMAVEFNTTKLALAGDPMILANDIGAVRSLSLAPISVSANGVLVYQGVGKPTRQMLWLDRAGRQISLAGEPGEYGPPRISPDGNRGVVAKAAPDGRAHLWLLDRDGAAEQITRGSVHEGSPVWSPDGARIAYFAQQGNAYDLYVRAALPDSRADLLLKSEARKYPTDWSHDGKHLLFSLEGAGTRSDVWAFAVGERRAAAILDTVFAEGYATLSPNGRWLAYQSDQSGKAEVYVQSFDGLSSGTKRRWQVSKNGGLPRWRADGNELFYITEDGRMMSVPVHATADGAIDVGQTEMLFQTRPVPNTWNLYDVSPDGHHFLVNVPLEWTSANPITVVTNWTEKLKD